MFLQRLNKDKAEPRKPLHQATLIVARRTVADRRGIAALLSILLLVFLISTDGFPTFNVWMTGLGGNAFQQP